MNDSDNNSDVDDDWPRCVRQSSDSCELEVSPKRWALGYHYCLQCGDSRKEYCSVTMHKSNSILITDVKQLKYVGVQTPRTEAGEI